MRSLPVTLTPFKPVTALRFRRKWKFSHLCRLPQFFLLFRCNARSEIDAHGTVHYWSISYQTNESSFTAFAIATRFCGCASACRSVNCKIKSSSLFLLEFKIWPRSIFCSCSSFAWISSAVARRGCHPGNLQIEAAGQCIEIRHFSCKYRPSFSFHQIRAWLDLFHGNTTTLCDSCFTETRVPVTVNGKCVISSSKC